MTVFGRYLRQAALASVTASAVLGAVLGAALVPPAFAGKFQPHRAVYELKLDSSQMSADIADLSGRMVLEWTGNACTGYKLAQRLVMQVMTMDDIRVVRDLRFRSSEAADGRNFEFDFQRFMNGEEVERIKGHASKEGTSAVHFEEPNAPDLALAPETVFPSAFSLALVETAEAGETTYSRPIYEGAEVDTAFLASAFIGKSRGDDTTLEGVKMGEEAAKDMAAQEWWRVQLSYHNPSRVDGVPEYQVAYHLYANGISSGLKMDYIDFKVDAGLSSLDYLPSEPCGR